MTNIVLRKWQISKNTPTENELTDWKEEVRGLGVFVSVRPTIHTPGRIATQVSLMHRFCSTCKAEGTQTQQVNDGQISSE